MTRQTLYNFEITRGDNNDYLQWAFRANSFYDAALILAAKLEEPQTKTIRINGEEYKFENGDQIPFSFYPAFFYVASHSIELILKAIALQSDCDLDLIIKSGHKLQYCIEIIKNTDFPFPKISEPENTIIKNMELVLSTGVVKYPNAKYNSDNIYKDIKASLFIDNGIKIIQESSLNLSTYDKLWKKLSKSLDIAVTKWLYENAVVTENSSTEK